MSARAREIHAAEGRAGPAHARLASALPTGAPDDAARGRLVVPGRRPLSDLPVARPRLGGLGRRRQPVRRLPQRVRLDGGGPRAPQSGRGDRARGAHGHAFRRHHRSHRAAGRRAVPTVPPRSRPIRELRDRSHDGRHPSGAWCHRTRRDLQDRRLVPRTSRRRHVLGHAEHPCTSRTNYHMETPASRGIPQEMAKWTTAVPYNDLERRRAAVRAHAPTRSPRSSSNP